MGRSTEHAGVAIFAADGSGRRRLVRIAVAAGAALLAAWLIALALGVLGGFDSLPGLPSAQSSRSHEASAPTHKTTHVTATAPAAQKSAPLKTVAPSPATDNSSAGPSATNIPKTPNRSTPAVHQPSVSGISTRTPHGRSSTHTTQTTGKPAGSPGNGPGGSGAPGRLR